MATQKPPRSSGSRPAAAAGPGKAPNGAAARGTAGSPAAKPARAGTAAGKPRAAVPASKSAAGKAAASKAAASRAIAARTASGTRQTGDVSNVQVTEPPAGGLWRRVAGYAAAHKLEFAALVVAVLGLAVSVYLTIEHYTQNSYAGCPANSTLNCGKVTSSEQSHILGIPVAVLGLAFYVFMVAATSPRAWRASQPVVHWARLGSVIAGIGFVIYLIYAELFLIGAICLYCTGVHVLTFILFALLVTRAAGSGVTPRSEAPRDLKRASRTVTRPATPRSSRGPGSR